MYCPNCGAESTVGLNYCKHCGGNLTETSQPGEPSSRNVLAALILAAATVSLVLGGLAIVLRHAMLLVGPQPPGVPPPLRDNSPLAGAIIFFGSAVIVLTTLMLIRLFYRVMGFGSVSEKSSRPARTPQFPQRAAELPAPPNAIPSVTEHTTRNFEPRIHQHGSQSE